MRRRISAGRTGETGVTPSLRESGASLVRQVESLERRIRRLESWRRSLERSEALLDRYRRIFQPPRELLEKGERDIQKLRELMEKKRVEVGEKARRRRK